MSEINQLVKSMEAGADGFDTLIISHSDWNQLKKLIAQLTPDITPIQIGQKYVMNTKKGQVVAQVTKENQKTWVMYEVEGSVNPGSRWMIGKTWCRAENIQHVITEARIPSYVRIK
jgi:hypothetical protein